MFAKLKITLPLLALPLLFGAAVSLRADFFALDPGVRGDPAGAGGPIDGLSANEKIFFEAGLAALLDAYLIDKALAELVSELDHRPASVRIPLWGLLSPP